jgi:cadmium resistance protein CadD (predicted permease)
VWGIGLVPAVSNIMSFGIYLTGFVVVIAGLIYGASLMHVPTHWIVVAGLVLVGIGILTGVKATRQKDSAS